MSIIIYHTNDTHARVSTIDDDEVAIGIDKISKIVNLSLLETKNTYWFSAGDILHGTPRININNGINNIKLLNPTHLNAIAVGNHDLNFGIDRLCELSKELNAYVLSANMVDKDTKLPVLLPYIIYDIDIEENDYIDNTGNSNDSNKDNIKMGVFGLTTEEAANKTNPKNIKNIEFLNPVKTAQAMVNILSKTCDVIVALTHLGLDESSTCTSKKVAEQVKGIDLIIDGHSHTELPEGLKVKNTLIVQTGAHDHNLGKVTINIKNKKIKSIKAELLNETDIDNLIAKPDTYISKRLKRIDKETDKSLNKVIAFNPKKLSGDRLLVRREESELGNLAAEACRYATNADISIVNGGDIRTDLPEGNITLKDLLAIFPFHNNIQTFKVKGSYIKEILEHSVEFAPASFGGFLTVSANVTFSYNPNKPPKERVTEIFINSQELDTNKEYIISMTDFIAVGGDGYPAISELKENDFDTVEDIFIKYITEKGIVKENYKLGRIKIVK